eukprot:TRINITY_DN28939_c0_g1_i1.p1 TRINITY_DN28939_c0_g1~~TRINITY_DN28939_c0_g1_i1.p1  ORF type:complete len:227 (+),score=36.09 TRINITY_DN28939_c0_g1_i1:120-800(+)
MGTCESFQDKCHGNPVDDFNLDDHGQYDGGLTQRYLLPDRPLRRLRKRRIDWPARFAACGLAPGVQLNVLPPVGSSFGHMCRYSELFSGRLAIDDAVSGLRLIIEDAAGMTYGDLRLEDILAVRQGCWRDSEEDALSDQDDSCSPSSSAWLTIHLQPMAAVCLWKGWVDKPPVKLQELPLVVRVVTGDEGDGTLLTRRLVLLFNDALDAASEDDEPVDDETLPSVD